MPRGGKRPGAGAPKGNQNGMDVEKVRLRQIARNLIAPEMPALIAAHVKHALGLSYLVYRDKETGKFTRVKALEDVDQSENTIEVWEKDPSQQSFTDLMNRLLDKPAEQVQEIALSGSLTLEDKLTAARNRLAKAKRDR
jgi:hypothetical protein